MDYLLKNLLKGSNINPPPEIEQALFRNFKEAVSIEWFIDNDLYEAVFYLNDVEHIARFDKNARLVEYLHNTDLEQLPLPVLESLRYKGEIMNIISFHKSDGQILFEIIYRDKEMKRYRILLDNKGGTMEENRL